MHIKRFTAKTVKEAMRAVKDEFGPDALILSNKRLPDSDLFEVVAAVEYDVSRPAANPAAAVEKAAGAGKDRLPAPAVDGNAKKDEGPAVSPDEDELPLAARASAEVMEELRELREFCWEVLNRAGGSAGKVFSAIEREMVRNGIDTTLSQKITMNAFKAVSRDRATDLAYIKSFIKKNMRRKLAVADPIDKGGIMAFVGPTGVGKTTTIAKLAAIHKLKRKKSVALLSMDTYRIAAADQLKRYGHIIGVPVEVARSGSELDTFIRAHSDKDLIMIDTAGSSQKDKDRLRELGRLSGITPKVRFNLVLSSQSRDDVLYETVRGYDGCMPLDSLTFTKLDEGSVHGPVLNAALAAGKPVAWLTDGQKVPEDIEYATQERLLNFMMPN